VRDLTGKTAFITGGGGGIGRAVMRALIAEGMTVAIADLSGKRLAAASAESGGKALPVTLDVRDAEQWEIAAAEAEDRLGPVSLLVNGAGIGGGKPVAEDDPARWKLVMEVNAFGTFLGCRTFLPRMLAREGESVIVNIASLAGLYASPTMSSYNASKHAVVGLSDTLRGELAGTGVQLSIAYPGAIRTGFVDNSAEVIADKAGVGERPRGVSGLLDNGMDPDLFARTLIAGIRDGDYHIFSHGGWSDRLTAHFADRLNAYGDESRFEGADDNDELDRQVSAILADSGRPN
jgi:NAD(P)-dependent dehydrogenase (short-subunit alcohol dehydrogenase family)